jgi:molecular chaperone GrpE
MPIFNNGARPAATVGVYIVNNDDKIFLIRSPKWSDRLVPPGGHIESGETITEAAIREVKEETGLDITDIEFLDVKDMIAPEGFLKENYHFVGLQVKAKLADDHQEPILDGRESSEYFWLSAREILERQDVEQTTLNIVKKHFIEEKNIKKECANCEENNSKTEEYKRDWQRALADYKNLQKETNERRGEWAQMSKAQILEDFIPVYDNFKSAFFHHPILQADNEEHKQIKNWIDGIGFIMKQFGDVMKNHGIEEIKTIGEKFDPNLHESMGEEEMEGKEAGIIVKELVGGYKMGNKVIKAAKVIIAK